MKIVNVIPGSGGTFYCQNCLRDNALVKALRADGHDAVVAPMYLPRFSDSSKSADSPIFFGAVTTYLKYKYTAFAKLPVSLGRWLDSPTLLRWVAKKSESVKARGLEGMTIAMLLGENGPMAGELDAMTAWLCDGDKPDVIHLSNPLLLGLAPQLKRHVGAPIVCSLQDETQWVDQMASPQREEIWGMMAELAVNVDGFIAVSRHYADLMKSKLNLPDDKIRVVPIGIDVTGVEPVITPPSPPVVGYLSKISASLGFDLLARVVLALKKDDATRDVKLIATGGLVGDDVREFRGIQKAFATAGFADDLILLEDFSRSARIEFLRSISLLSVPVPDGEAFGSYMIEAMAAGVPVVQPAVGAFPEVIEGTGGGVLYDPTDPNGLIDALRELLLNPEKATELGREGRGAVLQNHTVETMAAATAAIYASLIERSP